MAEKLTIKECQKRLGTSRSTTYRLLNHEPGVFRFFAPGSKKPVVRVDASVIDRILERSVNRA
jgi:predicted DNA-binding transcriptional regulator AlpA